MLRNKCSFKWNVTTWFKCLPLRERDGLVHGVFCDLLLGMRMQPCRSFLKILTLQLTSMCLASSNHYWSAMLNRLHYGEENYLRPPMKMLPSNSAQVEFYDFIKSLLQCNNTRLRWDNGYVMQVVTWWDAGSKPALISPGRQVWIWHFTAADEVQHRTLKCTAIVDKS